MAPLPLPPLYFYSLNSAESPAFYSSDSPPTHTHVHTPLHTYTHIPTHTHPYTHSYTHTPHTYTNTPTNTHQHTPLHTHPYTHTCVDKHKPGVSSSGVPTPLDQMHTQPPPQPSLIPFWLFPSEQEPGRGGSSGTIITGTSSPQCMGITCGAS